jgi:hypothetical protein
MPRHILVGLSLLRLSAAYGSSVTVMESEIKFNSVVIYILY